MKHLPVMTSQVFESVICTNLQLVTQTENTSSTKSFYSKLNFCCRITIDVWPVILFGYNSHAKTFSTPRYTVIEIDTAISRNKKSEYEHLPLLSKANMTTNKIAVIRSISVEVFP